MYTATVFSFVTLLLSALPAASAYYQGDNDFSLLRREAYLAGFAEGHAAASASLSRRSEEDDFSLSFDARDLLDDYEDDFSFWTRGNSQSSQAKKDKIKSLEEELDYARKMLADAQKDGMNGRVINDLKMKVMNAQGALAAAKGK